MEKVRNRKYYHCCNYCAWFIAHSPRFANGAHDPADTFDGCCNMSDRIVRANSFCESWYASRYLKQEKKCADGRGFNGEMFYCDSGSGVKYSEKHIWKSADSDCFACNNCINFIPHLGEKDKGLHNPGAADDGCCVVNERVVDSNNICAAWHINPKRKMSVF